MALPLTEEQLALTDSIKRLLKSRCSDEYLKKRCDTKEPRDPALWNELNSLGLLEYFAEPSSSLRDLSLIAKECGEYLLPEALIDTLFAGPFFLSHLLDSEDGRAFAQAIGLEAKDTTLQSKIAFAPVSLSPSKFQTNDGSPLFELSGTLRLVACAPLFDFCLATVKQGDQSQPLLVLCDLRDTKNAKVAISPDDCIELLEKRYKIELNCAAALPLRKTDFNRTKNCYRALKSMEVAGATARTVAMTVDYVKSRKQFGVQVGSFQSVQHRLADMYLASEAIGSLADFASWSADSSPNQLALAALSAIRYACEQSPLVAEGAIQLHGGIGFTYEYPLHLFLRRLKLIEAIFNPTDSEDRELIDCVMT